MKMKLNTGKAKYRMPCLTNNPNLQTMDQKLSLYLAHSSSPLICAGKILIYAN